MKTDRTSSVAKLVPMLVDEEQGDDLMNFEQAGYPPEAWRLLGPLLTESRRERCLAVAAARTRHIRLIVQDVHDPHNISACLRSADAFGVQDCDIVTMREKFRVSRVARGVGNWLTLRRWHDIDSCAAALRADGYLLAAGVPAPSAVKLDELPVQPKVALIFGNEHAGIAPEWRPHLDFLFTIPMYGMVESLNISVGAAISLQSLTSRARQQLPSEVYHLPAVAKEALLARWVCQQFHAWETILERLKAGESLPHDLKKEY